METIGQKHRQRKRYPIPLNKRMRNARKNLLQKLSFNPLSPRLQPFILILNINLAVSKFDFIGCIIRKL